MHCDCLLDLLELGRDGFESNGARRSSAERVANRSGQFMTVP